MSTLLRSECVQCVAEKQMHAIPEGANEEQKLEFLQRMFGILANTPKDVSAPVIVRDIDELRREIFGCVHDYAEEKSYYNQLLMKKEQGIREQIHGAARPAAESTAVFIGGKLHRFFCGGQRGGGISGRAFKRSGTELCHW